MRRVVQCREESRFPAKSWLDFPGENLRKTLKYEGRESRNGPVDLSQSASLLLLPRCPLDDLAIFESWFSLWYKVHCHFSRIHIILYPILTIVSSSPKTVTWHCNLQLWDKSLTHCSWFSSFEIVAAFFSCDVERNDEKFRSHSSVCFSYQPWSV